MKRFGYLSIMLALMILSFGCGKSGEKGQSAQASKTSSVLTLQNSDFHADLSGTNEVPDSISTKASGQALFKFNSDSTKLHYLVNVTNIDSVIMAHIHKGSATENGPILVWLYPDTGQHPQLMPGPTNGTLAEGVITAQNLTGPLQGKTIADLKALMQSDSTYVQVHTKQHPDGEIRGQIKP